MKRRRLLGLVKIREKQRNEALSRVDDLRCRLREISQAREELIATQRGKLHSSSAGDLVAVAELAVMHAERLYLREKVDTHDALLSGAEESLRLALLNVRKMEKLLARCEAQARVAEAQIETRAQESLPRRGNGPSLLVGLFALGSIVALSVGSGSWVYAEDGTNTATADEARPKASETGEAKLLRLLRKRSEVLRRKDIKVKKKEMDLAALEKRVDKMLTALRRLQDRVAKKDAAPRISPGAKPHKKASAVDLVGVVKKMKPRAASAMLAEMPANVAARILSRMGNIAAGQLLAKLPPDKAGAVAVHLRIAGVADSATQPTRSAAPAEPALSKAPVDSLARKNEASRAED